MLDAVNFLSSHPEIDELLIVAGKESSSEMICDCCRVAKLKKITICYYTDSQKELFEKELEWFSLTESWFQPETWNSILLRDLASFQKEYNSFAVLFDALNHLDEIRRLVILEPIYLIGTINRSEMTVFPIWEAFRKCSDYIHIQSLLPNHRDEILDWKRNSDSNLELSVIFPVYNVAPYLQQCIESIMQWDADYVEYLFVDDGSPDNSAEIISAYAQKDNRIKLLRKENGGCASARQFGLEHASGRYVGFVDPDDFIDPTMFKKLFMRALSGSYEISYCGYKELYETTGTVRNIEDLMGWPYNEGTSDRKAINALIAFRRIAIWRGIYLKEMLDRNGIHFYTDIRRFDDLPFKVETFAVANSVVCVPEYLYYYRMARPGQDVSADDERLYVHFQIFHYLDQFIRKLGDKEQLEYLQVVKIQTHQWALEKIKKQFIREYVKRAKVDMLSNLTAFESIIIAKKYTDKRNRRYNSALCYGQVLAVKALTRHGNRNDKKREHQLSELRKLAQKR